LAEELRPPSTDRTAGRRSPWCGACAVRLSQDEAYCGVWEHPAGATTFDEMLTKATIIGGGAPAAITLG
jgi:hypothetical protein